MPKALLDALTRLAKVHGYKSPSLILAENEGRVPPRQPFWSAATYLWWLRHDR